MFGNEEKISLNQFSGVEADNYKTVKIILKYGTEIIVNCKDFSVTKYGNSVVGYEINGIYGDYPMFISCEQIAAVLYLREGEACESSTA